MTNMNTTLNLKNIPKIVGIHGKKMFNECMGILNYTRWPIYISGPSGSGKSIIAMNLAKKYAQENNVPAYYVQLSPEQTKTSLILGLRLEMVVWSLKMVLLQIVWKKVVSLLLMKLLIVCRKYY